MWTQIIHIALLYCMKISWFRGSVKNRKIEMPRKMHFELNREIKMHKKIRFIRKKLNWNDDFVFFSP